jgi:hypothetical protein
LHWKGKLAVRIAESYKSTASLETKQHISQMLKVATWLDVIAAKLSDKSKGPLQNVDPFDIACGNINCQQPNFCLSCDELLKTRFFSGI